MESLPHEQRQIEQGPAEESWRARWRLFNFLGTVTLVVGLALGVQAWLFLGKVYWTGPEEARLTQRAWRWVVKDAAAGEKISLLPLPTLLTGLALRHPRADIFTAPRAVTAGFSIVAALGLLLLAHELFASRTVTAAAGVLAALDARRAVLSVVPLPEIQLLAWLFWGLYFALLGLRKGRAGWHVAAGACFVLAGLSHPAGWAFGGVYLALLAGRMIAKLPVPWWTLTANLTALLVFATLWVVFFPRIMGQSPTPLERLGNFAGVHSWPELLKRGAGSTPWLFVTDNLRQLNILGVLGVVLWWRRTKGAARGLLAVPAGALAVAGVLQMLGFSSFNVPAQLPWRGATPWSVALIPFTAAAIVNLAPRGSWLGWHLGAMRPLLPLGLFFTVAGLFALDTAAQRKAFRAPEDVLQTGANLRAALADARAAGGAPPRILIERTADDAQLGIEVMARDFAPFTGVADFTGGDAVPPFRMAEIPKFTARLKAEKVGLLVFRTPVFKRIVFMYKGTRVAAEFGAWTVFEMK